MSIEAKIIADSISPGGVRLTTMQLRYPRLIHSELLTHRVHSKNSSSTRAIPTAKLADMALTELVEPLYWGLNQPGMQSKTECLEGEKLERAKAVWRNMAEVCAAGAKELSELGLAKQWAGRPLEWFSHISVILTSTEWDNFYELRCHAAAQPELEVLANAMRDAQNASTPTLLQNGEWHLPYVTAEDQSRIGDLDICKMISAARCARVSYLKNDGTQSTIDEDVALYNRLVGSSPKHCSPVEHQATPQPDPCFWGGNFRGWLQHRQQIEGKD